MLWRFGPYQPKRFNSVCYAAGSKVAYWNLESKYLSGTTTTDSWGYNGSLIIILWLGPSQCQTITHWLSPSH